MKNKFKDYCKGKVTDLGKVTILHPIWEETRSYDVLMTASSLREFNNVRIIAGDDTDDNLVAITEDNEIVIDTPMVDPVGYACRMEFDTIDSEFYDYILKYWEEQYLDTYMEDLYGKGEE